MAPAPNADSITLSIPHGRDYHGVVRLVVGGLAARLALSYEHLEDLQLALESVLEREEYVRGGEVVVRLVVATDSIVMEIGPVDSARLKVDLGRDADDEVSLSRLLSTLVEDVSLEERDDGDRLRLEKRVPHTGPEPRMPA